MAACSRAQPIVGLLLASLVGLSTGTILAAESPLTARSSTVPHATATANAPTARQLLRAMLEEECRLDQLHPLALRFQVRAAANRPGSPYQTPKAETVRLEVDANRLRVQFDLPDQYLHTHTWDGVTATTHLKSLAYRDERYTLAWNPVRMMTEHVWTHPSLPPYVPRLRWTLYPTATAEKLENLLATDQCELLGRRSYRGHDCWVVENRPLTHRWLFDAATGALRGVVHFDYRPRFEQIAAERNIYGRAFKTALELDAWRRALSQAEKTQLRQRELEVRQLATRPMLESYYSEYFELAPGVRFPKRQTFVTYRNDADQPPEPVVMTTREFELVASSVGKPLDEPIVEPVRSEGAPIDDYREFPMMTYRQDKSRTKEQWKALKRAHAAEHATLLTAQAACDRMVGKGAITFPVAEWIGGQPMSIAALNGKPVLLYFWDSMANRASDDIETLNTLARLGDVFVIGEHASNSDIAEIRWTIKEDVVRFPNVLIPDPWDVNPLGEHFAAYKIETLPTAVVIDAGGGIAQIGPLPEALAKINELLLKKKKK